MQVTIAMHNLYPFNPGSVQHSIKHQQNRAILHMSLSVHLSTKYMYMYVHSNVFFINHFGKKYIWMLKAWGHNRQIDCVHVR